MARQKRTPSQKRGVGYGAWVLGVLATIAIVTTIALMSSTPRTTEPVVALCDDSAEPCSDEQLDNVDYLPVYEGAFTFSWGELNGMGSQSYYSCVEDTLDIEWSDTVPHLEEMEIADTGTAFILAVNVDETITNDELRELVDRPEGVSIEDLQALQVVRTPQITNTRDLDGSCEEFVDTRSQVRISLGLLNEDDQLITNKGIFGGCHNPWRIDEPEGEPSPSESSEPSDEPSSSPPIETPTTNQPKDSDQDPAANDNAGNGGDENEDDGSGEYVSPEDMEDPPDETRINPDPPEAEPEDPDANDGVVPTEGTSDNCDPDFQDCP